MTDPEVSVDPVLAQLAEAKAASRGERLEVLIEQWMRAYLADEPDPGARPTGRPISLDGPPGAP